MSEATVNGKMIDEMAVGRVYAQAAWNSAQKLGQLDDFLAEYRELLALLDQRPELEEFLGIGSLGTDHRQAFLQKVFQGRSSELLYNFLLTLNRHGRMGVLRAIGAALEELDDIRHQRIPVLVRSAVALDDQQLSSVADTLAKRFGMTPKIQAEVDPDLLGGLWVKVGDMVYDRSVRSNLQHLTESILTRSSHEIQSGRDYLDR